MNRTAQSVSAVGLGGALAVLLLFVLRVNWPDVYNMMGDVEKQAATVVVTGVMLRVWSLFGPEGTE